jgi:hypothetical protein
MASQAHSPLALPEDVPQRMAPSRCVRFALLPQGASPPQGIKLSLVLENSLMFLDKC